MIPFDDQVTTIDLTAGMQSAQGRGATDVSRYTAGHALRFLKVTRPKGFSREREVPQPISTLSVRATGVYGGRQRTGGNAGSTSAHKRGDPTAAEFSVDEVIAAGAESVSLSQPISFLCG